MALLYSLLQKGQFTFCLDSLMLVTLCAFTTCLAKLFGLLLVLLHVCVQQCHVVCVSPFIFFCSFRMYPSVSHGVFLWCMVSCFLFFCLCFLLGVVGLVFFFLVGFCLGCVCRVFLGVLLVWILVRASPFSRCFCDSWLFLLLCALACSMAL